MAEELGDVIAPGVCWFKLCSLWLVYKAISERSIHTGCCSYLT